MGMLENIYWFISRMIYRFISRVVYGNVLNVGKNGKFRMGGSLKNPGGGICIGDDFFIGKDFLLAVYPVDSNRKKYGKLQIGERVAAQERVRISAAEWIVIGNDVLMASDILITDNNHGMDAGSEKSYMCQNLKTGPVKIGNGCWIGEKCTVLPGSTIGEKSIIGANSVVTGSIPAYSIAAGVPAKVLKRWNFDAGQWEKEGVYGCGSDCVNR